MKKRRRRICLTHAEKAVMWDRWKQGDQLSSAIDFDDQTAPLDHAFVVAEYFDIKPKQANEIVAEVNLAVAGWRKEAKRLGVPAREIDRMASVFEHEQNQ